MLAAPEKRKQAFLVKRYLFLLKPWIFIIKSFAFLRQKPLHETPSVVLFEAEGVGLDMSKIKALEEWEAECRSEAERLAKARRFGDSVLCSTQKIASSLCENTAKHIECFPHNLRPSHCICATPKTILTLKGGTTVGLAIESSAKRNHILDRLYLLDLIGYCCVGRILCCYCHCCVLNILKPTYVFTSHFKRIVYF